MPQIFANIFSPRGEMNLKNICFPRVETQVWQQFFQPGLELKISPRGEILRVTVLWIAKVQKQLQNYSDFSRQSIVKNVKMNFLNIMLCYNFSLESVFQGRAKNNPTGKQIQENQATAPT